MALLYRDLVVTKPIPGQTTNSPHPRRRGRRGKEKDGCTGAAVPFRSVGVERRRAIQPLVRVTATSSVFPGPPVRKRDGGENGTRPTADGSRLSPASTRTLRVAD